MSKTHRVWLTADWHFGHANIIRYCGRPFSSVDEMDEALIAGYNSVVRPTDICYVLGDVGNVTDTVSRLNGTKILVRGNHDRHSPTHYYKHGFSGVVDSAELMAGTKNKYRLHLRHVPTRSLTEFVYLCRVYIRKMKAKGRPWKDVWYRLRREWRSFRRRTNQPTLCGHVHEKWRTRHNNINVGVDVNGFVPVSLVSILNELSNRR